jgi:hypothetical protein
MNRKLSESSYALLAVACEAYGIPELEIGGDVDGWIKAAAKDEMMAVDLAHAADAAARFDLAALGGACSSVRSFFEQRDVPMVRRVRDLTPGG